METKVKLHTTPSRWIREGNALGPQYRRVIGVETSAPAITTTIADPYPVEAAEMQVDTLTLGMPGVFAHRLLWYFKQHLASRRRPNFDCHHFAWWLTRGVAYSEIRTSNTEVYKQKPLTVEQAHTAPSGTLAVVNLYNPYRDDIDILHSTVKFGDYYLQVMARGGFLGILDHAETEAMAAYYREEVTF